MKDYLLALFVLAASLVAMPQEKADAVPALTTEQKLQIQVLTQKLEIAQLRAQAAQRDFDAARDDLQTLVKLLEKDGYVLDLQALKYVKKEPVKK